MSREHDPFSYNNRQQRRRSDANRGHEDSYHHSSTLGSHGHGGAANSRNQLHPSAPFLESPDEASWQMPETELQHPGLDQHNLVPHEESNRYMNPAGQRRDPSREVANRPDMHGGGHIQAQAMNHGGVPVGASYNSHRGRHVYRNIMHQRGSNQGRGMMGPGDSGNHHRLAMGRGRINNPQQGGMVVGRGSNLHRRTMGGGRINNSQQSVMVGGRGSSLHRRTMGGGDGSHGRKIDLGQHAWDDSQSSQEAPSQENPPSQGGNKHTVLQRMATANMPTDDLVVDNGSIVEPNATASRQAIASRQLEQDESRKVDRANMQRALEARAFSAHQGLDAYDKDTDKHVREYLRLRAIKKAECIRDLAMKNYPAPKNKNELDIEALVEDRQCLYAMLAAITNLTKENPVMREAWKRIGPAFIHRTADGEVVKDRCYEKIERLLVIPEPESAKDDSSAMTMATLSGWQGCSNVKNKPLPQFILCYNADGIIAPANNVNNESVSSHSSEDEKKVGKSKKLKTDKNKKDKDKNKKDKSRKEQRRKRRHQNVDGNTGESSQIPAQQSATGHHGMRSHRGITNSDNSATGVGRDSIANGRHASDGDGRKRNEFATDDFFTEPLPPRGY